MKNVNSKLLALAATLAIAATTAFAQTTLRADVPFSFDVNQHHPMQAGSYNIYRSGNIWYFANANTLQKMLVPAVVGMQSKRTDSARLVFECRGNSCALRSIQAGAGELGGYWPAPKRSKSDAQELARIVIVPLTLSAD